MPYFDSLPAAERRLMARTGGLSRVLKVGREASTEAARAGFRAKFDRQVDPDGSLDEVERAKLAELALRCHMTKLGLARAAKARAAAQSQSTQEVLA